jgi:hypothetical protein
MRWLPETDAVFFPGASMLFYASRYPNPTPMDAAEVQKRHWAPLPMIYWEAKVTRLSPRYNETGGRIPGHHVITLASPIPNDYGRLTITLSNGGQVRLVISKLQTLPYKQAPPGTQRQPEIEAPVSEATTMIYAEEEPMSVVHLQYPDDPGSAGGISIDLVTDQPARVFCEKYPNLEPRKK